VIDRAECIECGSCLEACPYDALFHDERTGYYLKCDLCSGRVEGPLCAQICPVGAITVGRSEVGR
jgi:Fe-S-cluster-containing hydrogenase component 2